MNSLLTMAVLVFIGVVVTTVAQAEQGSETLHLKLQRADLLQVSALSAFEPRAQAAPRLKSGRLLEVGRASDEPEVSLSAGDHMMRTLLGKRERHADARVRRYESEQPMLSFSVKHRF